MIHDPSKPIRSVSKGVTYRLLTAPVSPLLAFVLTGSWVLAGMLGALEFIIKVAIYYLHERVWHQIPFGKEQYAFRQEEREGGDGPG